MNRLQSELHRLFVPQGAGPAQEPLDAADLIDAEGRVRAMVLGLARPADWAAVSRVWQGVQADLGLSAPAIAVAGPAGYELWFSVSDAVPAAQAMRFLDALCRRYLADIAAPRLSLLPTHEPSSACGFRHAAPVPAPLATAGPWSAFVAPDLAPMFSEESWLDVPPNPEGQADLLSRITSIPHAEFLRVLGELRPAAPASSNAMAAADANGAHAGPGTPTMDPRRFLLEVMNDERVELALRIDAAKALLASTRPDGGSPA
jgi:hypothetical protein